MVRCTAPPRGPPAAPPTHAHGAIPMKMHQSLGQGKNLFTGYGEGHVLITAEATRLGTVSHAA
ncbi:hypothetical protein COI42_28160, partial [Priestia aryabhattai]